MTLGIPRYARVGHLLLAAAALLVAREAAAGGGAAAAVVLTIDRDALDPAIAPEAVRAAVEREFGARVSLASPPVSRGSNRLWIASAFDGRTQIGYHMPDREVVRTIALPHERAAAVETIALIAANLTRDEASEILARRAGNAGVSQLEPIAVDLLPAVVSTTPRDAPRQYRVREPWLGWIVAGSLTHGLVYAGSLSVALIEGTVRAYRLAASVAPPPPAASWPLYIPVVGPFIALGTTAPAPPGTVGILVADGLIQIASIAAIIVGGVGREVNRQVPSRRARWSFAPFGAGGAGGLAVGVTHF
jgi:hypothetical protein